MRIPTLLFLGESGYLFMIVFSESFPNCFDRTDRIVSGRTRSNR